jgi:hypothetical protein
MLLPSVSSCVKRWQGRPAAPPVSVSSRLASPSSAGYDDGHGPAVTAAVSRERSRVGPVWQHGYHDRIIRRGDLRSTVERFRRGSTFSLPRNDQ